MIKDLFTQNIIIVSGSVDAQKGYNSFSIVLFGQYNVLQWNADVTAAANARCE